MRNISSVVSLIRLRVLLFPVPVSVSRNSCEHVCPAVTMTSKTVVFHDISDWSVCLRELGKVCVCVCLFHLNHNTLRYVCRSLGTLFSAGLPRARHIMKLWCHHRETEHTSCGFFCLCFCFFTPSLPNTLMHTQTYTQMSHSHDLTTDLSHSYFMRSTCSLWSQIHRWLIDCLQTIFKLHSYW